MPSRPCCIGAWLHGCAARLDKQSGLLLDLNRRYESNRPSACLVSQEFRDAPTCRKTLSRRTERYLRIKAFLYTQGRVKKSTNRPASFSSREWEDMAAEWGSGIRGGISGTSATAIGNKGRRNSWRNAGVREQELQATARQGILSNVDCFVVSKSSRSVRKRRSES